MSDGFTFVASCPRCGGELLPDGFEPVIEAPDLTHHDARCDRCLDVIRVTVSTSIVERWPVDRLAAEDRRRVGAGEGLNATSMGGPRW